MAGCEFHFELMPLTFGRQRIIWTDGFVGGEGW